jgi:hypothetical protein
LTNIAFSSTRQAAYKTILHWRDKSISSVKETLKRAEEIGRELFSDGGVDSMENMFYSIEFRIRDEIGHDAKPYRAWWNGITNEWKF